MGLRFDLQLWDTDSDEYFEEVVRRASKIFQTAFDDSDTIFLVYMDYKYRRRKIRLSNNVFTQIKNLDKNEISFSTVKWLYDLDDIRNLALIKLKTERINYVNIFKAIWNSDFPPRQPRLDINGMLTSKEIYFININKKIIFNMYDDRWLDIIWANIEIIKSIYLKHNDLILEYDRVEIDNQFK